MRARRLSVLVLVSAAGLLAGCVGTPIAEERAARENVSRVGEQLRPRAAKPVLPELRGDSPPAEFVRYAVLNHPAVEAAYHDWRAAVSDIARARSLPDPQFTFEADVSDMLMTFMPGVMFDLMEPAKRATMGREAAATSHVAYRTYVAAVLRVAGDVRKAWVDLAYAREAQQLYPTLIAVLEQSLAITGAEYTTARMMGSLEGQFRLQNLIAEHHSHHLANAERLVAAWARFKSALGLLPADPNPPWPDARLVVTTLPSSDELWRRINAGNAELGKMRAMVDMAIAGVEVARKTRTPDFGLGAMADLKASPLMVRPTATLTLPIWRDKISGTIAAAEARRDAAVARVNAEQLNLAAELAQMLYMVRESDRMIGYIEGTALPNLERMITAAEVGYQSGAGGASMLAEARHMPFLMRLERLEALRQRESAVVDLFLLTADVAPPGAPVLADAGASSR
jgi:cobalt-zinc-cadmium efflux system outer membrane protein